LTKSFVLGKAKVMSYEDLEEARAKRIVKTLPMKPKVRVNVIRSAKCHSRGRGSHRRKGKTGSEAQKYCARGRARGARARIKSQDGADEQSASTIESLSDGNTDYRR
jgi:hypothetical protein